MKFIKNNIWLFYNYAVLQKMETFAKQIKY